MTVNTWIVVAGDPAISTLISTARSLGGEVTAAVVGPRQVAETVAAGGVDKVIWFGEPGDVPVEAYATAVADTVAAAPGVVLGGMGPSERVLLGAVAAKLQAPALTGGTAVTLDGTELLVKRTVYGGIAEDTVAVSGPVVLVLDGGTVPAGTGSAPIEEVAAVPLSMTVLTTKPSEFEHADLGAAARVVGIGRGLKTKDDLALIDGLAGAADAEIACSRPLAEGLDWLGRDRYIGCSGWNISPDVYFAIGISGQLQHMVGVRRAKTIVAINSDPNAPVFAEADYSLVGDLYEILPALTDALK
jgi:electron transfer flavoprotein alpha subunit